LNLPLNDETYRRVLNIPGKPLPAEIEPWTVHDLRRTGATGMARLNIAPHVVDKILNHVSGSIHGVAAVYNRFEYLGTRRAALEAWGRHIDNLLSLQRSNIYAFRK